MHLDKQVIIKTILNGVVTETVTQKWYGRKPLSRPAYETLGEFERAMIETEDESTVYAED